MWKVQYPHYYFLLISTIIINPTYQNLCSAIVVAASMAALQVEVTTAIMVSAIQPELNEAAGGLVLVPANQNRCFVITSARMTPRPQELQHQQVMTPLLVIWKRNWEIIS